MLHTKGTLTKSQQNPVNQTNMDFLRLSHQPQPPDQINGVSDPVSKLCSQMSHHYIQMHNIKEQMRTFLMKNEDRSQPLYEMLITDYITMRFSTLLNFQATKFYGKKSRLMLLLI